MRKTSIIVAIAALVVLTALCTTASAGDHGNGCPYSNFYNGTLENGGGIYFDVKGHYDNAGATQSYTFENVPGGRQVVRMYPGIWLGSLSPGRVTEWSIEINGHVDYFNFTELGSLPFCNLDCPPEDGTGEHCTVSCTGCGACSVTYNASPYVVTGDNDVTYWTDEQIYQVGLLAVYANESMEKLQYWIKEGQEYPDTAPYHVYFNESSSSGPIDTGNISAVEYYSYGYPHCPGESGWPDLNGNYIGSPNITKNNQYANVLYGWTEIPPAYIDAPDNCFLYPTLGNDRMMASVLMLQYGESGPNQPPVADPNGPYAGTEGSSLTFDGSGSYDSDGSIVSYEWDFGDGNTGTGVNPAHTYTLEGTYTVTLTVTDDDAATDTKTTTATVTAENIFEDVANADVPVQGTVTGSYLDTHTSDDVRESIEEVESRGKPASRYSYLEHKWTIDVTGGSEVTFYLEAYRTDSGEGDDFEFAYSTDDSNYINMETCNVTKTADDDMYQSYVMPNTISGTVYICVQDTDRTAGKKALDTLYIDHMFIRSVSGPPSYGVTATIDEASQQVKPGESTTYTVRVKNTGGLEASYSVVMSGTAVDETTITVTPQDWNTGTLAPNAEDVRTVTVPTTIGTPETTYTLTATATCEQDASVKDSATSDLVVSSAENTMHIYSTDMWSTKAGQNYKIYTKVKIVDSSDVGVAGATVYLNTTLPDDTNVSSSGDTLDDGTVEFMYGPTKTLGTYTSTVTDVEKTGWDYDSGANVETSDSITI